MRRAPEVSVELVQVSRRQQRVATRAQLISTGLNQFEIRAQLAAQRWTAWGSHVVLLQNREPDRRQLMWAALLDAGEPAALVSHTALELAGFRDFAREALLVHVLVPRGAKVTRAAGVTVHESRRVRPDEHLWRSGLRCTGVARSALDAAAWQPWPRFACALVAAVVQQRLVSAAGLEAAMQSVGQIRHKPHLRLALKDLAGGAEALSELDLARVCRRFGLQPPRRQVRRRGTDGRSRYLDAEWVLPDGRRVVLEVDGAHHLDVEHWQADMQRERSLVVGGTAVLRATAVEMRVDPRPVVEDLVAVGVPKLSELS